MTKATGSTHFGFSLRPATADDRSAIRQMVRSARLNPMGLKWRRFLVAVDRRGKIVGCGQIKTHRNTSQELASIVVRSGFRGRGVARAIIQRLLADHESPIWLTCASPLVPFYEKFGFHRTEDSAEIPPIFRRATGMLNMILCLIGRDTQLAIMVRESGVVATDRSIV